MGWEEQSDHKVYPHVSGGFWPSNLMHSQTDKNFIGFEYEWSPPLQPIFSSTGDFWVFVIAPLVTLIVIILTLTLWDLEWIFWTRLVGMVGILPEGGRAFGCSGDVTMFTVVLAENQVTL